MEEVMCNAYSEKDHTITPKRIYPLLGDEITSWDQCVPPPRWDHLHIGIEPMKRFQEERKDMDVNTTADWVISIMEKMQNDIKTLQEKISTQEKTVQTLKDEVGTLKKDGI